MTRICGKCPEAVSKLKGNALPSDVAVSEHARAKPEVTACGSIGEIVEVLRLVLGFALAIVLATGCGKRDRGALPGHVGEGNSEPTFVESHWPATNQSDLPTASVITSALKKRRAGIRQGADPAEDDWDGERLAEAVAAQLKTLAAHLKDPRSLEKRAFSNIVLAQFRCEPLRPVNLSPVYEDKNLKVVREGSGSSGDGNRTSLAGYDGFLEALHSLVLPFGESGPALARFKVFDIEILDASLTTKQLLTLSGPTNDGFVEVHTTWSCRWLAERDDTLKLLSIAVEDFEQTASHNGPRPLYADCTEAIFRGASVYHQQLRHGKNHWASRLVDHLNFGFLGSSGITVGDVNGDNLDDVYVAQPGGLPNRLLVQQPDGTVLDLAAKAGLDILDFTFASLIVDFDNDGDQDIAVLITFGLAIYENDGSGRFVQRHLRRQRAGSALSVADFDGDGYLDIYVCAYQRTYARSAALPAPHPYHDANNGGRNILLRNEIASSKDSWRFTDVTDQVGLDQNNSRFSFAAGWEDLDNDGDQDLYVANDFGRNNLYRNDTDEAGRRKFVDIAAAAGAEDRAQGMSVAFGDYNRDGWMDIYVANMFSAAGRRITNKERFQPKGSDEAKAVLRRFTRGNTLLKSLGGHKFEDVSAQANVTMGRWGWAALLADINNDGWEDIWATNGYITGIKQDVSDL